MTELGPEEKSLLCYSGQSLYQTTYFVWQKANPQRTIICVHGLTRNARDFDSIARALAEQGFRVVCPDIVGRGKSDHLTDPRGYNYTQYLTDILTLIARLDVEEVDWIGTSMGGIIGMLLAALPQTPISRLVLNDVGPFIEKDALEAIAAYVGEDPHFADLEEAEGYFRQVHAGFGRLPGDYWQTLTENSVRPVVGGYRLAYDPEIAAVFRDREIEAVNLWPVWDQISCKSLVVRGAQSRLLLPETVEKMKTRFSRVEAIEFPNCGHAPSLATAQQIRRVCAWLL